MSGNGMLMGPQKENQELVASIRGVLRNDRDDIVTEFAASIGVRDSNEAECLAIVFALEQSLDMNWLSKKHIIIESDSKIDLAWVNKNTKSPWSLHFANSKLLNILLSLKKVSFAHVHREANMLANNLAKRGANMDGCWI
jgi:ribonuclease HI